MHRRIRPYSWLAGWALLGVAQGAAAQAPPAEPPAAPGAEAPAPEAPAPEAPAPEAQPDAPATPEPPAAEAPAPTAPTEPAPTEGSAAATPPTTDAPPAEPASPSAAAAAAAPVLPPPAEPAPAPPPDAQSQPATPIDTGATEPGAESAAPEVKSRWRGTQFYFEQSLNAQALGIGDDYQSSNPSYEWALGFDARYYFIDRQDWRYYVRGIFSISQELTNSDTTTQEHEVDVGANDTVVQLRYNRTLRRADDYVTAIALGLPELMIPTSKASRNNGRILGVGAAVIPIQQLPLMHGDWLKNLELTAFARYQHYFADAQYPTNDEIGQERTDLDGNSLISDQLSASPFAKHETRFGFTPVLTIHDRLSWLADFQWRPTWNYEVDRDAEVCVITGCTDVDGVDSPESFEVITSFRTEFEAYAFDSLSFTLGYINIANQLGPDGQRRSMFYSSDARFYFAVNFYPSELLGPGRASDTATAARGATF